MIAFFFLVIGLLLGILGGGGAILTVPLLAAGYGFSLADAVPLSFVIVASASLAAASVYMKRGWVSFQVAFHFFLFSSVGVFFGKSVLWNLLPEDGLLSRELILSGAFVLVLVWAGRLILLKRPQSFIEDARARHFRVVRSGLLVGTLTGLLGVGGGFVIVPALRSSTGLETKSVVATSLFVIFLNSTLALGLFFLKLGFELSAGWWSASAPVLGLGVSLCATGAALGTWIQSKLPEEKIRQGFAFLLFAVALSEVYRLFV